MDTMIRTSDHGDNTFLNLPSSSPLDITYPVRRYISNRVEIGILISETTL